MFWTKWIKVFTWISFVLMLIGSIVMAVTVGKTANGFAGFLVFVFGVFMSINAVALVMMLISISDNVNKLLGGNAPIRPMSAPMPAPAPMPMAAPAPAPQNAAANTWTCACGTQNEDTHKFCRGCGKPRS